MGYTSVIGAFAAGVLLAGGMAVIIYKKLKTSTENRLRDRCKLAERENKLRMEEWTQRKELEYERRETDLEQGFTVREAGLKAREEEATAGLSNLEKERAILEKRRLEMAGRFENMEQSEDRLIWPTPCHEMRHSVRARPRRRFLW